jgi:signal transduction histidine kinase
MPTLGVAGVDALSVGEPPPPGPLRAGPETRVARAMTRLRSPSRFDGLFTPLQRRVGVLWACVVVPSMAAFGLFATTPDRYVFIFVFFASGAFTTPALYVALLGVRNGPPRDRTAYALASAGLAVIFLIGCAMLLNVGFGWTFGNPLGPPAASLAGTSIVAAAVLLTRGRSGGRALSVDLVEAAMALLVVVAPAVLIWGERVVTADQAWFTVPAACGAIITVFAAYWTAAMLVRGGPEAGTHEAIAVGLALTGAADAVAQIAQGLSGFTLPASPLLVIHALCMSQLLLLPLFLHRRSLRGLDRLPPQAQVRGGALVAVLTLVGLPILLVTTLALDDRQAWTVPISLGVLALLLVLAAARHLLNVRETQRLYGHLASASEERRALLAQVMKRADDDRHRVAAELHEQAVSAYASFVSFIQAVGGPASGAGGTTALTGASTLVRDDLARHAESLRSLMLAIKPLEPGGSGTQALAAPVRAFVDSLYGDRPAPAVRVEVADGLVLDWISETVALRIIQEALRNVWRHSDAARVDVTIALTGSGLVEVRVADDGVGFDPVQTLFESGIAAMRSFAGAVDGRVTIDSAPGRGTSVIATLGRTGTDDAAAAPAPEPRLDGGDGADRPRLRLVRDADA